MRVRVRTLTLASVLTLAAVVGILWFGGWVTFLSGRATTRKYQMRTVCANNLRQMGTVLVSERAERPWPRHGGSALLLRLYFTSKQVRRDVKIFRCPADGSSDIVPGSPEHVALFEGLDPALATWPDGITSYAARNRPRYPLDPEATEAQPLACDAGPWHEDGVNVLFDNGKLVFMEWADLGLADGDGFHPGPGGPPLLEPLCTRPQDR